MADATFTLKIGPVADELVFECSVNPFNEWTAKLQHHPDVVGDGLTKMEAVENALILYFHVLIRRIQRGRYHIPLKRVV